MNKKTKHLLNVQNSGWSPASGFEGLMNSIRTHGAHVFIGKFGSYFHKKNSVGEYPSENLPNRKVFGFSKGSYKGDELTWTHAIVVDQVKLVNGVSMVSLKTPMMLRQLIKEENIYVLSYSSFIDRLRSFQNEPYDPDKISTFGTISSQPLTLTSPFQS